MGGGLPPNKCGLWLILFHCFLYGHSCAWSCRSFAVLNIYNHNSITLKGNEKFRFYKNFRKNIHIARQTFHFSVCGSMSCLVSVGICFRHTIISVSFSGFLSEFMLMVKNWFIITSFEKFVEYVDYAKDKWQPAVCCQKMIIVHIAYKKRF